MITTPISQDGKRMNIIPFIYDEKPIRVVTDAQGSPWFVAKDLADILGHRDAATAVRSVEDDEKCTHPVRTPGGEQEMICVSESGLYRLMLRSDKTEAKPFQKWVVSEVLPSLRKTGSYEARPSAPRARLPLITVEYRAALALAKMIGITGNAAKIAASNALRKLGYEVDALALMGAQLVNERQEVPLNATDLGQQVGLSAVKMNRFLASAGMQERKGDVWESTDKGRPFATLLDSGKRHSNGTPITQLKWASSVLHAVGLTPAVAN